MNRVRVPTKLHFIWDMRRNDSRNVQCKSHARYRAPPTRSAFGHLLPHWQGCRRNFLNHSRKSLHQQGGLYAGWIRDLDLRLSRQMIHAERGRRGGPRTIDDPQGSLCLFSARPQCLRAANCALGRKRAESTISPDISSGALCGHGNAPCSPCLRVTYDTDDGSFPPTFCVRINGRFRLTGLIKRSIIFGVVDCCADANSPTDSPLLSLASRLPKDGGDG